MLYKVSGHMCMYCSLAVAHLRAQGDMASVRPKSSKPLPGPGTEDNVCTHVCTQSARVCDCVYAYLCTLCVVCTCDWMYVWVWMCGYVCAGSYEAPTFSNKQALSNKRNAPTALIGTSDRIDMADLVAPG